MRVERFKMEREGLVTEGQEVEISERSAVTRSIYISGRTIHRYVRNLPYQTADQSKKRKDQED